MCEPFALFDELRFGGKSHKVTLDNKVGVLFPEEEWWSAGAGGTGGVPALALAFVEGHGRR
jgi:hypothetical protein